jgi:hypothetical protein
LIGENKDRKKAGAEMTTFTFPPETMPKAEVKKALTDWVDRLNRLFEQVDRWRRKHCPDAEVTRFEREQIMEPLISSANLKPRKVPFYALSRGKKRISFGPSSRWIAGANGRVNLSANRKQFSLVDVGEGGKSEWMIVTTNIDRPLKPFNEEAFSKLVEKEL